MADTISPLAFPISSTHSSPDMTPRSSLRERCAVDLWLDTTMIYNPLQTYQWGGAHAPVGFPRRRSSRPVFRDIDYRVEVDIPDENSESNSGNDWESDTKSDGSTTSSDIDDVAPHTAWSDSTAPNFPTAPTSTPVTSSSGKLPQMAFPTLPRAARCRESSPTYPMRGLLSRLPVSDRFVHPRNLPSIFPRGAGPDLNVTRRRSSAVQVVRVQEDGEKTEE